jgi:hypothetical protein
LVVVQVLVPDVVRVWLSVVVLFLQASGWYNLV